LPRASPFYRDTHYALNISTTKQRGGRGGSLLQRPSLDVD